MKRVQELRVDEFSEQKLRESHETTQRLASQVQEMQEQMNSNKSTDGMESSVVLVKPRIHLFACTHPSVSISLVCNDWLAYKHQSKALFQTRLDCGPCFADTMLALLIREDGSTSEHRDGLCAVVSSTHEHIGATASDLG